MEDRLVGVYRRDGLEAALDTLRHLDEEGLSVADARVLLHRLASHLEEADRPDAALRALGVAVERFRWASWPPRASVTGPAAGATPSPRTPAGTPVTGRR